MDDLEASDDSITTTSTLTSDKGKSYKMESILAANESNGATVYLTAGASRGISDAGLKFLCTIDKDPYRVAMCYAHI